MGNLERVCDSFKGIFLRLEDVDFVSLYECSKFEMCVDIGRDGSEGLQSGDDAVSSKVSIQKVFEEKYVGNGAAVGRS